MNDKTKQTIDNVTIQEGDIISVTVDIDPGKVYYEWTNLEEPTKTPKHCYE